MSTVVFANMIFKQFWNIRRVGISCFDSRWLVSMQSSLINIWHAPLEKDFCLFRMSKKWLECFRNMEQLVPTHNTHVNKSTLLMGLISNVLITNSWIGFVCFNLIKQNTREAIFIMKNDTIEISGFVLKWVTMLAFYP